VFCALNIFYSADLFKHYTLMNTFIRQKAVKYKINKLNVKENIVKMREDDYKLAHMQLNSLRMPQTNGSWLCSCMG
jgi:hypothetical protein